jgi:anti-sigma regulatory factor (Ser/Thr protein kinase)
VSKITKEYQVKARDFGHAGEGSIKIKSTLKSIGFDPELVRKAAICAYEAEMNLVMHGGDGSLTLSVDNSEIVIEVEDSGPGIEDIERAFQEGYSTAADEFRELGFGAGMGLPNIKKNSDSVEVVSEKGEGTHIKIHFRSQGDGG